MTSLHIAVNRKFATCTDQISIICSNSDYIAVFSFDAEWNEYPIKTARFITEHGYNDVTFSGNKCPIPMIMNASWMKIGVFAGELHTTTSAFVKCKKSVICDSNTENNQQIIINSPTIEVADVVEQGNMNPVTSNAVYQCMSDINIDDESIIDVMKRQTASEKDVIDAMNEVFSR